MKNIFNNLGYLTKQNIIGIAVGVTLVAGGLAVVNMNGPQTAKKAVLGGAGVSSYAETEEGSYAPELAQAKGGQKGGQKGGATGGENGGQYEGSASAEAAREAMESAGISPFSNETVAAQGAKDAGAQDSEGAKDINNSPEAAALSAGVNALKAKNDKESGITPSTAQAIAAKMRTEKGKLQASSRIGGGSGGSSGARGSTSVSYTPATYSQPAKDSASKEIPQAAAQNLSDTEMTTRAHGRAGSMGGYGVKAGEGVNQNTSGANQQLYTVNELVTSAKFSHKGKQEALANQTAKGFAFARDAFEGSNAEAGGIEVTGLSIGETANSLDRAANNLNLTPTTPTFKDAETEIEEQKDLKQQIVNKLLLMIAVMSAAMFVCSKLATIKNPWAQAGAFVVAAGAILALTRFAFWGNNSIFDLSRQMDNAQYTQSSGKGWRIGISIGFVVMSALIILSCFGSVVNSFKDGFKAGKAGEKLANPNFFSRMGKAAQFLVKPIKWIGSLFSAAKSTTKG